MAIVWLVALYIANSCHTLTLLNVDNFGAAEVPRFPFGELSVENAISTLRGKHLGKVAVKFGK